MNLGEALFAGETGETKAMQNWESWSLCESTTKRGHGPPRNPDTPWPGARRHGPKMNKPTRCPQQFFKILECFCTGTLRNFVCYVYRNLPGPHPLSAPQPSEPHQLSGPEPSGTSSAICTRTRRNRVCYLHRNHSEPSGTLSTIYTGTLRNLISFLHRNTPEPSPEPGVAAAPDRTKAILG